MTVIGLGNKGRSHVKNLLGLPGVRITALCDVDPERLAAQVETISSVMALRRRTTRDCSCGRTSARS
jgi:predicted dehydrogenase